MSWLSVVMARALQVEGWSSVSTQLPPLPKSYTFMQRSAPAVTMRSLEGKNFALTTLSVWPVSVLVICPVLTAHTRAERSAHAPTTWFPSEWKPTLSTLCMLPPSVVWFCMVLLSHSFTVLSSLHVAKVCERGSNCTSCMSSLWASFTVYCIFSGSLITSAPTPPLPLINTSSPTIGRRSAACFILSASALAILASSSILSISFILSTCSAFIAIMRSIRSLFSLSAFNTLRSHSSFPDITPSYSDRSTSMLSTSAERPSWHFFSSLFSSDTSASALLDLALSSSNSDRACVNVLFSCSISSSLDDFSLSAALSSSRSLSTLPLSSASSAVAPSTSAFTLSVASFLSFSALSCSCVSRSRSSALSALSSIDLAFFHSIRQDDTSAPTALLVLFLSLIASK
mmetsp:Transcript_46375/g.119693  ORF Transcript_46375/g.119693 Transcript_46375/m.119693 type:complete len:400 (+) Transcript_46375:606-1805(+)